MQQAGGTLCWLSKGVRGLNSALALLSAFIIVATSLVLVYEVITRYLISVSNDWVVELCVYMLIAATFLSAAHTQRERGHVGIEVLDEIHLPRFNHWRQIFGDLLSMLFCGLVAYLAAQYAWEAFREGHTSSSTWSPKLWVPYSFMAVGMGLLTVELLIQLGEGLSGRDQARVHHIAE